MITAHKVDVVAIGNGTASKESEIFIAGLLKEVDRDVKYMVISEAGASVYSASKLAAEEFPDFDVMQRSAVSIARRLQDPLAELVKIEPRSIGVGQYQHDMKPARLDGALPILRALILLWLRISLNIGKRTASLLPEARSLMCPE